MEQATARFRAWPTEAGNGFENPEIHRRRVSKNAHGGLSAGRDSHSPFSGVDDEVVYDEQRSLVRLVCRSVLTAVESEYTCRP